ncbi:MAG: hypothetical protein ABSC48_09395 [Terracidiphilus sp.]|jgi:hypothetical protein
MNLLADILSNLIVAFALRATLGGCLIYIGRVYYADPLASFRGSARPLPYDPLVRQTLRAMAGFCLWGGCFILATAVAVGIFGLHGKMLAAALLAISVAGAWLLLPRPPGARAED